MAKFMKISAVICLVMLSVYGVSYAQDDDQGGQGDAGGSVSDESSAADVPDAGNVQTEVSDTGDTGNTQTEVSDTGDTGNTQVEVSDTGDTGNTQVEVSDTGNTEDVQAIENDAVPAPDEARGVIGTSESYEEYQSDTNPSEGVISTSTTYPVRKNARVVRPAVVGVPVATGARAIVRGSFAGLLNNTKISDALSGNKVRVGMTKKELVAQIGYPPDGAIGQGPLFSNFVQSRATAAGKEESWTYQISKTVDGVKSVTFKIVDGKVAAWNEWLDTGRK
ncbi:MAG: hypothetical protein NTY76_07635 [Candidatus Omnitrophica bacterium]|nr:hypothetical protein [Candidatus Omnitrophota bacterium]